MGKLDFSFIKKLFFPFLWCWVFQLNLSRFGWGKRRDCCLPAFWYAGFLASGKCQRNFELAIFILEYFQPRISFVFMSIPPKYSTQLQLIFYRTPSIFPLNLSINLLQIFSFFMPMACSIPISFPRCFYFHLSLFYNLFFYFLEFLNFGN